MGFYFILLVEEILKMGIDLNHKNRRKVRRKAPRSPNDYLKMLVKVYRFIARRTKAKFNHIILKRMFMSSANLPPCPISKIATLMKHPSKKKLTAVIVGTVTNDVRMYTVPKNMKICCLSITDSAHARVERKGGRIMTFDQLAREHPIGKGTVLMQGCRRAGERFRHFGRAPGLPGSHTKPYVRHKSRKFEKARGRRSSTGYKK